MDHRKTAGTKTSAKPRVVPAAVRPLTHTKRAKDKKSRCYLLALPAELRNRIYELVIPQQTRISICTWMPAVEISMQPPLSRTCRQIRDESLPIYYAENTFSFIPSCAPPHSQAGRFTLGVHAPYIEKMKKFEFETCPFQSIYHLDMSEGMVNFELEMLVRGAHYVTCGQRTLIYAREGQNDSLPNVLQVAGALLYNMVAAAKQQNTMPVMNKLKLRELMQLLHGDSHV